MKNSDSFLATFLTDDLVAVQFRGAEQIDSSQSDGAWVTVRTNLAP